MRVDLVGKAAAVAILTLVASCGGGDPDPTVINSHEELCAGAPPETAGGYVTVSGCAFLQHSDNIARYGQRLPENAALYDGTGTLVARVTHGCDAWLLGTDEQGVTVIVRRDQGTVTAHGSIHPGQALSQVASPVRLPVEMR
jgi:hypothetical protein